MKEIIHLDPETQRLVLGAGDRGHQRVLLTKKLGLELHAGKRDLYRAKVSAAGETNASKFALNLTSIIAEPQSESNVSLTDQLSDMPLHSIVLDTDTASLSSLSQSILHTKNIANHTQITSRVLSLSLVQTIKHLAIDQDIATEVIESKAARAIRANRNLAVLDDATLSQLLLSSQTGVTIPFTDLANIYKTAAIQLTADAYEQGLPERLITDVILLVSSQLAFADKFITVAKDARVPDNLREPEDQARERGIYLAEIASIMTSEHVGASKKFTENDARQTALLLIESFFAHRIHWTSHTPEILGILYQNLCKAGHENVANEVILQAQKSGLITKTHNNKVLDSAELPVERIRDNWAKVDEYMITARFSKNPEKIKDLQGRATLFLGFFNTSHIGHRNLAAAAMFALEGIPILVSVNTLDPTRLKHPDIVPLAFDQRANLVVNNMLGLIGNSLSVSSIDYSANMEFDPPLRISKFVENTGIKAGRVCGYDRINLTPESVDPIFIGMRGRDLQNILQDADIIRELKQKYPSRTLKLLVLQGTTKASSTSVYRLAKETLGEIGGSSANQGRLDQFRSQTHPANRIPILSLLNH